MSRLSKKDADTLRSWLDVTATAHAGGIGIAMPGRPLGLMLLVHLSLQPAEAATYTALRTDWKLHKGALTAAVRPLKDRKLVAIVGGGTDGRARQLQLTDQGRDVVGRVLKRRSLAAK